MENPIRPFLNYLPIEKHGLIGDRRAAALVAADGTINWGCLPNYDSQSIFNALLDAEKGGFWRFGPANPTTGRQIYREDSMLLVTRWSDPAWELELTDAMLWPDKNRKGQDENRRVIVRYLRCLKGPAPVAMLLKLRPDFQTSGPVSLSSAGLSLNLAREHSLGFWSSLPFTQNYSLNKGESEVMRHPAFILHQGEEWWAVAGWDENPAAWSVERARAALDETEGYWKNWLKSLSYTGPRSKQIRRSAMLVHLLSYAPSGALVAAPTTSLPEKIGGSRNYDYRYAWIRDASLSLASLSLLGQEREAEHYMDWLVNLGSSTDAPLQVVYRISGATDLSEQERSDLYGYQGSQPVRYGNHAYQQRQLDSLGYLCDCALVYLEKGGRWKPEYWELVQKLAEYTVNNWQKPDSGIWEMDQAQYVSSKIMSWVTLDRASRIAGKLGLNNWPKEKWQRAMEEIKARVMEQGWSEKLGAFRQILGIDKLDASVLLIPLMGFLPASDPKVVSTVKQIENQLTIDGFVYRYRLPGPEEGKAPPLGEIEGAFLACSFWLAATYAKGGQADKAEEILKKAETVAGELGLFAEEVEPKSKTFLGNTPLLFSQVEYIQAVIELAKARPLDMPRLMVGQIAHKAKQLIKPQREEEAK